MIGNTHTANMCAPAYIAFHQNLSKSLENNTHNSSVSSLSSE